MPASVHASIDAAPKRRKACYKDGRTKSIFKEMLLSRSLSQTARAGVLALAAAFPAAAQQLTLQQTNHSDGAGVILKAVSGKAFQGHINVRCNEPFVSFYKAGSEAAITISNGRANKVFTADGGSVPLEKTPADLDPAKLCVAGRPDVSAARTTLLARLAKD